MRVLFLRHGESARNAHTGEEPLSDELGDMLTERGRAQADAAGAALRGQGITRLITSPMRRATETAEAVGAALDLEAGADPAGLRVSPRRDLRRRRSSASTCSRSGSRPRPPRPATATCRCS